MNVSVDGQAELAPGGGQYVSGSYFSTLGVRAVAGRTFTAEDDKVPGQHPVAVISYSYWEGRFARDPSAVGKTIYLNGNPFTVIGVTPPQFFGISAGHSPDIIVWAPGWRAGWSRFCRTVRRLRTASSMASDQPTR